MPEDITSEELPGESQLNSSDSDETVITEGEQAPLTENQLKGLSLDELNETLGKQFKDKDSAIKAIKDTFSYVGKKVEQVENELKNNGFISKRELEDVLFYRDNPEVSKHKDIIDAYANKFGISPQEAAKSEALNGLFERAAKADSYESNQSVIESNPRFVESKSNLDKAREMSNESGRTDAVESLVAKAVLDVYEN